MKFPSEIHMPCMSFPSLEINLVLVFVHGYYYSEAVHQSGRNSLKWFCIMETCIKNTLYNFLSFLFGYVSNT